MVFSGIPGCTLELSLLNSVRYLIQRGSTRRDGESAGRSVDAAMSVALQRAKVSLAHLFQYLECLWLWFIVSAGISPHISTAYHGSTYDL